MLPFADTPSLGILVGLPVAFLLAAVAVIALVVALRARRTASRYDRGDMTFVACCAAAALVVVVVATAVAMWPWKYEYRFWQPVEGNVQEISKRLVANGDKGMSEKFVVTINGFSRTASTTPAPRSSEKATSCRSAPQARLRSGARRTMATTAGGEGVR